MFWCRSRGSRSSVDRFPRRKKRPWTIIQLRRGGGMLRTMCEASRGRQLRLIRAETDSGRNDGLLNTLTCRQPSARLHFLHPSPFASFTTWPNFARTPSQSLHELITTMFACWKLPINLHISFTTIFNLELAIGKNISSIIASLTINFGRSANYILSRLNNSYVSILIIN